MRTYAYTALGLKFTSDIELPEWPARNSGGEDVRIRACAVAKEIEGARFRGVALQASADRVLLRIDSAGRYLVAAGREILVDARPDADDADVRLYLLGPALGALLHQRGLLPLHGSAIETPRGAAIFIGPSGHGKSTLAGLFYRRGYRVLADEIAAVNTEGDGPVLFPGSPCVCLMPDSLARLEMQTRGILRVQPGPEKYRVAVGSQSRAKPVPVQAVYVLSLDGGTGPELKPLAGFAAARALSRNTYHFRLMRAMGARGARHFQQVCALAQRVRIVQLTRCRGRWELNALAEVLERDFGV